jgi:hypothetical protein
METQWKLQFLFISLSDSLLIEIKRRIYSGHKIVRIAIFSIEQYIQNQ